MNQNNQTNRINLIILTLFFFLGSAIAESGLSTTQEKPVAWVETLVKAAQQRTKHQVTYSGQYIAIEYPGGDVPDNIGVCTDVVIRSYRQLGIDLQQKVHEDMLANFSQYPQYWGLKKPDSNIDHRRVPNLQTFFTRFGKTLKVTNEPDDYKPGDLVTWMIAGSLPHIGIVSNNKSPDGKRHLIIHNIGSGPQEEDFLFGARITGHYRYY